MTALLLTRTLTFAKHSGVIAAFGEHFIRTEMFPKEFGTKISRLFRERQLADYEAGLSVTIDDAKEDLLDAEEIRNAIQQVLKNQGFLPS